MVIEVICPRCRRQSTGGLLFCPGCGAPLSLRPEPRPAALDDSLSLDRRLVEPEPPRSPAFDEPFAPPRRAAPALPTVTPAARPAPAVPPFIPAARPAPAVPPVIPAARPAPAVPPVIPAARPAPAAPPVIPAAGPAPVPRPPEAFREPAPPPRAARPARAAPPSRSAAAAPRTAAPLEVHLRRASSVRRGLAWAVDGLPFLSLFALALRATLQRLPHAGPLDPAGLLELAAAEARGITLPMLAGAIILFAVYHALSHGLAGATLGKLLLGLRVVGPDGDRPGLGRSAWRAVVAAISLGALGLGVLLALFTRSGRALHDFLARTSVVEAP